MACAVFLSLGATSVNFSEDDFVIYACAQGSLCGRPCWRSQLNKEFVQVSYSLEI